MIFSQIAGAVASGLAATFFMTLSEFRFWMKWGMKGLGEWQIDSVILSEVILRKATLTKEQDFPWTTVATHFLDGVIASVSFYLLLPLFYSFVPGARISILYDAIVYSLLLCVIFLMLGRSTIESFGRIRISNRGLLASLLSHIVYGIFLGLFLMLALGL